MSTEPFTPLEDARAEATVFTCPLCGGRFTHGGQVCASCPLAAGCDLVQCPHCRYTFPRSSRIADLVRRWFRRGRRLAS